MSILYGMNKADYSKLLEDPRWQKKRLEIFQRDGWACTRCGDTTTNLQVHHKKYIYGRLPWEYSGKELVTLCKPCHKGEHGGPLPVAEVIEKVSYEGLYKEELPVLTVINKHIADLNEKLREPLSDELQEEILRNIMFLQSKRRELTNV